MLHFFANIKKSKKYATTNSCDCLNIYFVKITKIGENVNSSIKNSDKNLKNKEYMLYLINYLIFYRKFRELIKEY